METQDIRELLAGHEFFRGLDPAAVAFIAGCGTNVRFAADQYLFREGEPADYCYVLRAGRVALETYGPDRGPLVLDSVAEADIVGTSWLFPPYRWELDARAVEPVRAIRLDAGCLRAKCEADPRLGYELMKRFAEVWRRRMQSARLRLLDLHGPARRAGMPADVRAPRVPPAPLVPRPFRVVTRTVETPDTVTLGCEPVDGAPIGFRPGQFAMLYAFGVGEVPISMSGASDGLLRYTVRAVGAVTRAICATGVGEVLGVRGPYGSDWDLATAATGADVVIVAGGIGLAPLRPAVEQVLARRARYGRLAVLVGARSPALLLFPGELARWRVRLDTRVEVTVDVGNAAWRGDVGLVTELLSRLPFDPANAVVLLCGPEIMMRRVAAAVLDRGVPAEAVRLSMERNMKCAIGQCGHCQFGPEFICRDGPVFRYPRVARLLGLREV